MTNSIHNAVVKTLHEGGLQEYMGPAYQQASQKIFAPTGSATTVPLIVPQSLAEGSIGVSQPISLTVPPQFSLVFTSSTPMTTSAQGGFMPGYPVGWDPASGLGMPLEFFIPSTVGQASSSASQPANQQVNASAPQLTQPQDSTLAPQPAVPNASVPQSTGPTNVAVPTNVSASGPTYHQQNLAMLIQPKSPTEVLMSRSPHGNGVTWIFHDPTTSFVHHVNVPCIHPVAQ